MKKKINQKMSMNIRRELIINILKIQILNLIQILLKLIIPMEVMIPLKYILHIKIINLYIASPLYNSNYLDIFYLIDNKKIISLKHQRDIQGVKYFFNKKNNNEYLVASNYDVIYIRDISNNYKLMYEINILHGNCLLIFLENNKMIIL